MNRIKVEGIDYTTWADGLQEFQLSIQRNTEDGAVEYGTTLDIRAEGKFYDLIYSTFFDNICEGRKKQLEAVVEIDNGSCNFEIDFLIVPDGIDICFDGCAEITLQYVQPDNDAYICLKQQVSYWSTIDRETYQDDPKQGLRVDPEFYSYIKGRVHKILYCQDWTFISYLLFLTYAFGVGIVFQVVKRLCDLADLIGLDGFICRALDYADNAISGCNKYHTAVLIKDIFEYNFNKCGLQLESSILNDPVYKWTALESAVGGEGYLVDRCNRDDSQFNGDNARIQNVLQLAKTFETVFNSDFRIKNGKFTFERKDYFYDNAEVLLNLDDKANELEECPKWRLNADAIYACWEKQFVIDTFDHQGNKNINQYNEIVEWNPEANPNTKGKLSRFSPYSPSKWSNDQNIKTSLEQRFLANIRSSDNPLIKAGTCDYTHAQIIQDGQLSQDKLILIDPVQKLNCSGCKFATAQKVKLEGTSGIFPFGYRFVYSYNDGLKGQALYDRFHYIDDPNGEGRIVKLDSVTWYPSDFCDAVGKILEKGLDVGIESGKYGKTIPEKIDVNFAECSITFSELKFKCLA